MDQELSSRIVDVIARTHKIPREDINADSTLEELGIDSFDGVNLLFALEDEFNITIPDDAKELKSVRDITLEIEKFLKNKQSETNQFHTDSSCDASSLQD